MELHGIHICEERRGVPHASTQLYETPRYFVEHAMELHGTACHAMWDAGPRQNSWRLMQELRG